MAAEGEDFCARGENRPSARERQTLAATAAGRLRICPRYFHGSETLGAASCSGFTNALNTIMSAAVAKSDSRDYQPDGARSSDNISEIVDHAPANFSAD